VAAGVLALGGVGALVHDVAQPGDRAAVVVTPLGPSSASGGLADAHSIWSELLQLDAAEDAAVRAGLSPDVRAAVDGLDRTLADREAPLQASPTIGVTEMYGAFWAAPPPEPSTIGLTEMYGAFWAAHPEHDPAINWLTATYGAFWAAPPPA
jgi:hypothetical protein